MARLFLALGLVAVATLHYWFRKTRESGTPSDVLEEIVTTAKRMGDAPLNAPDRKLTAIEELANVARKVTSTILPPSGSTSGARGLRNNNPGNIRKSADKWQGLTAVQDDPAFFKFVEPKWGVRAIGKILLNYEKKYSLRSVRDLISRWAPPVENLTDSYVKAVARAVGVDPDTTISVHPNLPALASAIIRHENGTNPYTAEQVREWVYLP